MIIYSLLEEKEKIARFQFLYPKHFFNEIELIIYSLLEDKEEIVSWEQQFYLRARSDTHVSVRILLFLCHGLVADWHKKLFLKWSRKGGGKVFLRRIEFHPTSKMPPADLQLPTLARRRGGFSGAFLFFFSAAKGYCYYSNWDTRDSHRTLLCHRVTLLTGPTESLECCPLQKSSPDFYAN